MSRSPSDFEYIGNLVGPSIKKGSKTLMSDKEKENNSKDYSDQCMTSEKARQEQQQQ